MRSTHFLGILACLVALGAPGLARAQTAPHAPIDGIACQGAEGEKMHIHQHLGIFADGTSIAVPADVGRPPDGTCLYWLHTHTPDGIVHIESPVFRTFTLGEFFDVWGQPLSKTRAASARAARGRMLRVLVDGKPFAGDPRSIELTQHADIVLEAGRPVSVKPFAAWNGN